MDLFVVGYFVAAVVLCLTMLVTCLLVLTLVVFVNSVGLGYRRYIYCGW